MHVPRWRQWSRIAVYRKSNEAGNTRTRKHTALLLKLQYQKKHFPLNNTRTSCTSWSVLAESSSSPLNLSDPRAQKRSPAENADSGNDVFCCAFTNGAALWQLVKSQDVPQQLSSLSEPEPRWHACPGSIQGERGRGGNRKKNQVIYRDHVSALLVSSDPASMLLTPPSARNRQAAKLPGICTWLWNLPVPFPSQSYLQAAGVCWWEPICMHPFACGHMMHKYPRPASCFLRKRVFFLSRMRRQVSRHIDKQNA